MDKITDEEYTNMTLKVEDTYKVVEETIEKVESEEDNATN